MKKHLKFLFLALIFSIVLPAQQNIEDMKTSAIAHMDAGRYGEAIDLFNKIVTALPRVAENYFFRGRCFEVRSQYQQAVLDYRRANNLAKSDNTASDQIKQEISQYLASATAVWHASLNKRIAGYKREIAINPTNPFNYLEIGKAHRWLEQWIDAEEWYDKYLDRDNNASPDEIIRYSEILAKNKHIKKGEQILKIYVERFPEDWRLWSKYGYFTYWLGNNKTAKRAFETALSFKPFFKEAMDGLDKANRQPYVRDYDPRAFEKKEYPIDRYFRLLRNNANDYKSRYSLIDELIKAKRIEEAYQQLQYLSSNPIDTTRFETKWRFVTNYRDSLYNLRVEKYQQQYEQNPYDKETINKLAEYYEYLDDYDRALEIVEKYFERYPDETDKNMIYRYARLAAWIKDFNKALELIDNVLDSDPDNLDYQLFKAQILVWTTQNLDLADRYLRNVEAARPNDIDALVALGSLRLLESDFDAAKKYAERAKKIDSSNPGAVKLQSNIEFQMLRSEEEKLLSILEIGRELFLDGECAEALNYYDNYLRQAEPTNMMLKEFGDVHFCAGHYQKALEIYSGVLESGFDYDVAIQRAKVYYMMGDSVNAVSSFKEIVDEEPDDFDARLYLGDALVKLEDFDSARAVYNTLRTWDLDSTEISLLEMRKNWFPLSGLEATLDAFPNYIGFAPSTGFYSDNTGFRYFNIGGRLELGINNYVAIGASFFRTNIRNSLQQRNFTSLKGHIFVTPVKNLRGGIGFGKVNTKGFDGRNELDAYLAYELQEQGAVRFNYIRSDAGVLLYSPFLVETEQRFRVDYYKLDGYYIHKPLNLKFSGYFQYIDVEDLLTNNAGNDFQLRVGYYFLKNVIAGYEFYYQNYRYNSNYYYSPINFESHSAWGDWDITKTDQLKVTIGGKLGYVTDAGNILRELYGKCSYEPVSDFKLEAIITLGSTYRQGNAYVDPDADEQYRAWAKANYNYASGRLSIYWSL